MKTPKDQYQKKLERLQKATGELLCAMQAFNKYGKTDASRFAFSTLCEFENDLVDRYGKEWILKSYNYDRKHYFVSTPIK